MALKSLLIKEAELTEDLIEKVASPFLRYTETGKIISNPDFKNLSISNQILVYLVAKSGLPLVTDKSDTDISSNNSELEKALNIKGNTLRPRLSELRVKGYIITENNKHKISNHSAGYVIEQLKLK